MVEQIEWLKKYVSYFVQPVIFWTRNTVDSILILEIVVESLYLFD